MLAACYVGLRMDAHKPYAHLHKKGEGNKKGEQKDEGDDNDRL